IDVPDLLRGLVKQGGYLPRITDVGFDRHGLAAGAPDLRGDHLRRVGTAGIAEGHIVAVARRQAADGGTDAARSTRHQKGLGHASCPFSLSPSRLTLPCGSGKLLSVDVAHGAMINESGQAQGSRMSLPPYTRIVETLPSTVPFVGPEAQERK